ncbi:MAG: hypothetical protein KatS3mg052_0099 [Candidatus Roseilinea sp.]|nr:MAG: hypothetical protein KatS3mg052_0099 [Candidatus Roseilinea sp.]
MPSLIVQHLPHAGHFALEDFFPEGRVVSCSR